MPGKNAIFTGSNSENPLKVLLVDDEKEFVETLSERLGFRGMEATIVYDGNSALDYIHKNPPEVMVIDLKMPGIDGMEVLKKVKQTQSGLEVIVLTGHGSEQDRKDCINLGAFAYMQKPVDINLLTNAMFKAYEKSKTGN